MTNLLSTKSVTALAAMALSIGSVTMAAAQTATPTPTPAPAATPTPAATPAPAATPRLTFAGLLDFYYQYNTNNPQSGNLTGPSVNFRQNQPTLDLAQLDANYAAPSTGGFGAHVTLINGDTANIDHAFGNGPGPGTEYRLRDVMQVYGTLINKTGYGVDFGEFYTPFGYEADNDSNLNANYSFSDVYFDLLPVYNAGLRFYTPTVFNGWVFKAYVVNALNDTAEEGFHDANNAKGLFGVAAYTDPKGKFTFTENYGFSHDQNVAFGNLDAPGAGDADGISTDLGNKDDTTLSDTDLILTLSPKYLLGGEFVYRSDSGTNIKFTPNIDSAVQRADTTIFNSNGSSTTFASDNQISRGYAGYFTYNLNSLDDLAFRYSYVDQRNLGRPYDLTATYALKSSDGKWLTKFEYRYDAIYKPFAFEDSSGNFTKTSGNTFTVGEVYMF
jgi:hypothetical protein